MILNRNLANELFRAFTIKRWNDRLRPMELYEMDKHAHKMMIAWCLGKYEEARGLAIDWERLVRSGIFELYRRIVISDIKSPIYDRIKLNSRVFRQLNEYVLEHLLPDFGNTSLEEPLREYLTSTPNEKSDLTCRVLGAAHIYASYLEFQSIYAVNPSYYQNIKIQAELLHRIDGYSDLAGIQKLIRRLSISNFVDLCGQLRFQIRWAQIPRIPETTVLGHSLMVAIFAYFMTNDIPHCAKRIYDNFFCGLFHDLPEVVTRDIISPIKRSTPDFENLISDIEHDLAEEEIFPLVEPDWINEIKYFTQDEFSNKYIGEDKAIHPASIAAITKHFNSSEFSPLDGRIVRIADRFSAFLEAWNSVNSGIKSDELTAAIENIGDESENYAKDVPGITELYNSFKN